VSIVEGRKDKLVELEATFAVVVDRIARDVRGLSNARIDISSVRFPFGFGVLVQATGAACGRNLKHDLVVSNPPRIERCRVAQAPTEILVLQHDAVTIAEAVVDWAVGEGLDHEGTTKTFWGSCDLFRGESDNFCSQTKQDVRRTQHRAKNSAEQSKHTHREAWPADAAQKNRCQRTWLGNVLWAQGKVRGKRSLNEQLQQQQGEVKSAVRAQLKLLWAQSSSFSALVALWLWLWALSCWIASLSLHFLHWRKTATRCPRMLLHLLLSQC